MLEVEVKFPVNDPSGLRERLVALGARPGEPLLETDHYFNAPDRNFAFSDEALRIRQAGGETLLTYKGPKLDATTKTRAEIELELSGGVDRWTELLEHLGYRPVASVVKRRAPFTLRHDRLPIQVLLDEVQDVGVFVELEVMVEASEREKATKAVLSLAQALGLGPSERRSYLEMLLAARAGPAENGGLAVVATVAELRRVLAGHRRRGKRIALVPTMGALHAGHASLIRAAATSNDCVVVSIFVNPTQFGPNEDYQTYPRSLDADLAKCRAHGASVVFAPSVEETYPPGDQTVVEVVELQKLWEGASRPGHFRGVATVVAKLFNQVQPDVAYFGQKDAQQVRVIQQMVRDLHFPIDIRVGPTVREPDGLAMSSRNRYLSPGDRQRAAVLSQALKHAQNLVANGEKDARTIRDAVTKMLEATEGVVVDYVAIVDAATLQPVDRLAGKARLLLAARVGGTRLIDNEELVCPAESTP